MSNIIYLDNNATTKIDPRVLEAMMPFLTEEYGNASSSHRFGASINRHVKLARSKVAELIRCEENEIVFTGSSTEAINLAIKGVVTTSIKKRKHIVTVATEHAAVLDTCSYLEKIGYQVTYLPVGCDGVVDLNIVEENVKEDTTLVCVMLVNNETGVIQPIEKIAQIAHSKGVLFMTDATQAVGKMPVFVNEIGIDLMSFSGHKFYGPKGIGVLFIQNQKSNKINLETLIHGGGHERGMRSGTLNVPAIVGIGKAAELALTEMDTISRQIQPLRYHLEKELLKIDGTYLNGHLTQRLYNVSNICFKGLTASELQSQLRNIMVSNGSACSSNTVEPSHVLKAMGRNDNDAYSSLRFSLGRYNSMYEIDETIKLVKASANYLKENEIIS